MSSTRKETENKTIKRIEVAGSPLTHMTLHNHYSQEEHLRATAAQWQKGRAWQELTGVLSCQISTLFQLNFPNEQGLYIYFLHYFLEERSRACRHVYDYEAFLLLKLTVGESGKTGSSSASTFQEKKNKTKKWQKRKETEALSCSLPNSHTLPDLWTGIFLLLHEWMRSGHATVSTSRQAG